MNISVIDPFGIAVDSKMAFLAGALDPVEVERQFERHVTLASGEKNVHVRAVRVTRYKPGRRCLIEYDLEAGRRQFTNSTVQALPRGVVVCTFCHPIVPTTTASNARGRISTPTSPATTAAEKCPNSCVTSGDTSIATIETSIAPRPERGCRRINDLGYPRSVLQPRREVLQYTQRIRNLFTENLKRRKLRLPKQW